MTDFVYLLVVCCVVCSVGGVESELLNDFDTPLSRADLIDTWQSNPKAGEISFHQIASNISDNSREEQISSPRDRECRFSKRRVDCRLKDEHETRMFKLDFGSRLRKVQEQAEMMDKMEAKHNNELPFEK